MWWVSPNTTHHGTFHTFFYTERFTAFPSPPTLGFRQRCGSHNTFNHILNLKGSLDRHLPSLKYFSGSTYKFIWGGHGGDLQSKKSEYFLKWGFCIPVCNMHVFEFDHWFNQKATLMQY